MKTAAEILFLTCDNPKEKLPDFLKALAEDEIEYDGEVSLVFKSMELFAQQESIAFAEWIDGCDYECHLHTDDGEKIWNQYGSKKHFTTEQLYQLYKER